MKQRHLFVSVVALLVLSTARLAFPQTADEIVEKHLAALGGRAALGKLTSRVVTGTITVSTPAGDVSGSIEVYSKLPNKSRTLVKIDGTQFGLGQIVQDQRFNGTTGYVLDTLNGNREMTGDQLEASRVNMFPSPLLKYKDAGVTLESVGREKVGDRDAYVLKMSPKSGPASRLYFDAESYLLVKTVTTINVPQIGADVEQTVLISDYRDVDGVKVPYVVRSTNQFQTLAVSTTKVSQNMPIDDQMFSKPE